MSKPSLCGRFWVPGWILCATLTACGGGGDESPDGVNSSSGGGTGTGGASAGGTDSGGTSSTGGETGTTPSDPLFFAGIWLPTGRATDLPCDASPSAAQFESGGFIRDFRVRDDGVSYSAYRCTSEDECTDSPILGEIFRLDEGVWRTAEEDLWTDDGVQCSYIQFYHEHLVEGDFLYQVTYRDERPVGGDPTEFLGCDEKLSDFVCESMSVTKYERAQ